MSIIKSITDVIPGFNHLVGTQVLYDPNTNIAFVCVLKNAHSWAAKLFADNLGCHLTQSPPPPDAKFVVILRHPIARWISGFSEFMTEFNKNSLYLLEDFNFLQIVFKTVRWDDHTTRQVDALVSVNMENCVFFKCNGDLEKNLIEFVSSVKGVTTKEVINNNHYNRAIDGNVKSIVYSKLQTVIAANVAYKQMLLDYYENDMQLIAYINEHNLWYSPNTNT